MRSVDVDFFGDFLDDFFFDFEFSVDRCFDGVGGDDRLISEFSEFDYLQLRHFDFDGDFYSDFYFFFLFDDVRDLLFDFY